MQKYLAKQKQRLMYAIILYKTFAKITLKLTEKTRRKYLQLTQHDQWNLSIQAIRRIPVNQFLTDKYLTEKKEKYVNWQFIEKETQMANTEHNLSVMKEMQIKISVRWNFTTHHIEHFFFKLAIPDPDVDKDVEKV